MPTIEFKPSVGTIVHYVMEEGRNAGEDRPAIIVRLWTDQEPFTAQLQVFTDDMNDDFPSKPVIWKTSRCHSHKHELGTYHAIWEQHPHKEGK